MLNAAENLLREGRLQEAVSALQAILRDHPENAQARTFLFELLCFSGDYGRAEKQLKMLAGDDKAITGVLNYYAVLHAEQTRQEMFQTQKFPVSENGPGDTERNIAGSLNGQPFTSISDANPQIGGHLEIFSAGEYLWIQLRDVAYLEMQPPKRLRDLLWAPVKLRTGLALQDRELNDVYMPVVYPLSWMHDDDAVRLGRLTEWCQDEAGAEAPYGQKMLLVDGSEVPILELRTLEIEQTVSAQV